MHKSLRVLLVLAFASLAAIGSAQASAASDLLAIGGKDTAWFNSQGGRVDTDSEPQALFKKRLAAARAPAR